MAYNGSGTYSLVSGNPVTTGTTISSTWANNTLSDIANNGLSYALTKDGQQTPTANIPLGGFKITGLGAATARTDAIQYAQVQDGSATYLTSVAGTNTITASVTGLAAYATGSEFGFIPANTNTGATTLNINSIGAKSIFSGGAALTGGEIRSGVPIRVQYDGTQFNILGRAKRFVSAAQTITAAGSLTLAHGLGAVPTMIAMQLTCTSTDAGYSVNDVLWVDPSADGINGRGVSVVPDSTNLNIRYGADGGGGGLTTFDALNKTNGGGTALTNTKWTATFYAWVL